MSTTNDDLPMTTPSNAGVPSPDPQPGAQEDALKRLLQVDIPREQQRLRQIKDATADQVMMEQSGTVFEIMKELGQQLLSMRDWAYQYMTMLGDHLEANDERLDLVEQLNSETIILSEDADVFAKVAVGCKLLATQRLQGPFPIQQPDEEGKSGLMDLIALCDQSDQIVGESTLSDDEDGSEPEASQTGEMSDGGTG